jgi:hypothetical protein
MEQMTEFLKAMQEMMETQRGSLASKMDTNQAQIVASQEWMIAKTDGWLEEMKAW